MDRHTTDALVVGYEDLIPTLQLPDQGDRHVLAAAIRGGADVIVTANLKDFPREVLATYGMEAQHPDEFVVHLLSLAPDRVPEAAQDHWVSLKNPPKTESEYLQSLERQGLLHTVSILRTLLRGSEAPRS